MMKLRKYLIGALLIIGVARSATAFQRQVPQPIAGDFQIVSDDLQHVLKQKGLEYADSVWPKDLAKRKVDPAEIPQEVLAETKKWLRTMIKQKYLPADPNKWLVGIRTREADYLIMRYSVGPHKIQVQENGPAVRVLIEVNDPNLWKDRTEDFIAGTVREFLNYPPEKLSKLKFQLKTFKHTKSDQNIFYGTIDCDFDFQSNEAWEKRTWWNHTYIWTDGKRVYFSLVEMDGKPVEPSQAKPGIRRRFLKK